MWLTKIVMVASNNDHKQTGFFNYRQRVYISILKSIHDFRILPLAQYIKLSCFNLTFLTTELTVAKHNLAFSKV